MAWQVTAGIAQLLLTGYFLATHGRRMSLGNDLIYAVPMGVLAVGTLLGISGATAVAALFYSVWMLNHLFSWWIPYLTGWPHGLDRRNRHAGHTIVPVRRGRPTPDLVHTGLGVLSLVVLVVTWFAAVKSHQGTPVA